VPRGCEERWFWVGGVGGAYQVHDGLTREHQFLDERTSGLRLFERDVDLYLVNENIVTSWLTIGSWNCGHTKFHIRRGQSRRSSARPSSPVSRSGTRYDVGGSEVTSSCLSARVLKLGFPFLRFGFWFFARFRGFSNATFNRSIGSSVGMYLCNINDLTRRRVERTAYPSARKAKTAESIPPEKSTATLASPWCFLDKTKNSSLKRGWLHALQ